MIPQREPVTEPGALPVTLPYNGVGGVHGVSVATGVPYLVTGFTEGGSSVGVLSYNAVTGAYSVSGLSPGVRTYTLTGDWAVTQEYAGVVVVAGASTDLGTKDWDA